jgi:hypothetical protein
MAQERTASAMKAGIDLTKICLKCEGHGTAPARGLLERMRALFALLPCLVCYGRGEVRQSVAAERLAGEVISKARSRAR